MTSPLLRTARLLLATLALCSPVAPALASGSVAVTENVAYALGGSPLFRAVDHLEFHPVASGLRAGKPFPLLEGARIGPYTCFAREPGFSGAPEIYQYRVEITTQASFFNAAGEEVTMENGAVQISEVADGITITALPESESRIGPEPPVVMAQLFSPESSDILQREALYLGDLPLRIGMTGTAVETALAARTLTRAPAVFYEATGEWVESWTSPEDALQLDFSIDPGDDTRTLIGLSTLPGSSAETLRGIRAGSTEERARAAYAAEIAERESTPGEILVIGSLYEGLFLRIVDGRVATLFLGQGAE